MQLDEHLCADHCVLGGLLECLAGACLLGGLAVVELVGEHIGVEEDLHR
jgi:hypothetical protein